MMYSVGQRVAQFAGTDGLFLTIDESGVFLLCRMNRPTLEERNALKAGQPIQIGMGEMGGILVWTVGFGSLNLMDCTYNPQIAAHPPVLVSPEDGAGYALTVILADGATGEVLNIRLIGLPHDFSVELKKIYDRIKAVPIDYRHSLASIYARSTEELDDMATVRCVIV